MLTPRQGLLPASSATESHDHSDYSSGYQHNQYDWHKAPHIVRRLEHVFHLALGDIIFQRRQLLCDAGEDEETHDHRNHGDDEPEDDGSHTATISAQIKVFHFFSSLFFSYGKSVWEVLLALVMHNWFLPLRRSCYHERPDQPEHYPDARPERNHQRIVVLLHLAHPVFTRT